MWIFCNIVVVCVSAFIGLPYFLQAYYKWKFPEEYREWEEKSVEEWYGKKYLKKHFDDEETGEQVFADYMGVLYPLGLQTESTIFLST